MRCTESLMHELTLFLSFRLYRSIGHVQCSRDAAIVEQGIEEQYNPPSFLRLR